MRNRSLFLLVPALVAGLTACNASEGADTETQSASEGGSGAEATSAGTSGSGGSASAGSETGGSTAGTTGASTTGSSTGSSTGSGGEAGTAADTGAEGTGTTGDPADDYEKFEIRLDNYAPPPYLPTWYTCFSWNLPVEQAVHLVGFRPHVVDPHVHHYVLGVYPTQQTFDPALPCTQWVDDMVWGWAPGMGDLWLPEHVGLRAGDSGFVTFVLQVHYNNPVGDAYTDNSGFDAFYTKDLRQYDAGVAKVGDIGGISIPPGMASYEHVAECNTAMETFPNPTNVVAFWMHAHELGRQMWSDIERGGSKIGELGREDDFDFDGQTYRILPEEIQLQSGDVIKTHCIYDSTDRTETTPGGEATQDEMCINFVMYYPDDPDLEGCGTI